MDSRKDAKSAKIGQKVGQGLPAANPYDVAHRYAIDVKILPMIPSLGEEVDSRKDAMSAKIGQRPDRLSTCSSGFGMIGSKVMFTCTVHVVRLWKFPAVDALATGLPGMAVLSSLMQGATVATITHAVTIIRRTTSKPQQNNLLAILGAFSVPLVESTEQLIHLIGKEPIVDSELFTTLFEERYGEELLKYREQLAAKDEELYHKDEELHHKNEELYHKNEELYHKDEELQEFINGLQYTLVQTLVARFPQASDGLQHQIRQVATTTHLTALFHTIATAQSLSDIEATILRMQERSQN